MSDFRYIPRSALVGPAASGRIPEHWLKGRMPGRDSFDHVPLAQFVLLSMLLHALAITLFGAPTGGSREGRAMWGTLNVLIMGPVREALSPPVPAPLPRVAPPAPPKPKPAPPPPPPAPPREAPQETLPVEAAPTQTPLSFPPLLDRIQTPETAKEIPELKVPLPLEAPVSIPSPIEKVQPREPKLEMAPAVELPPIREPPPVPAPLPLPAPVPAPPPPVPPPVERAPVVETPVLPSPPPPVVTPPVERAPVEAPALPVPPIPTPPVARPPIEVPPLPVPSPEKIAPPPVPAEKVQPAETAVVPATPPPAIERLEPPAPIREVPVKRESELPPKAEPTPRFTAPLPGPSESPFRSAPKKPDAGKDYDPTAPSIDMEAVRKRAGAIAREGTGNRALLPFPMPPKPEHKTKEQIAIENARKPDCRSAYASLGLAAIIPLIANEFGEGSCRW